MRVLLISLLLLSVPALTGCIDGGTGGGLLCIGTETPQKIIQSAPCKNWVIEVDHVTGQAPDSDALNLLKTRMNSLVHKDSITVTLDDTTLKGDSSWTDAELRALDTSTRDHETGGNTVVTHLLYVDGVYGPNNDAVGVAYGSRFVVIFQDRIEQATSGILVKTTASQMEQAVLVHEFGHILGLVNGDTPMQTDHEDDENKGHSNNPDSVMYWAVESTTALDVFGDGAPPTQFDANDRADICAAGGKC